MSEYVVKLSKEQIKFLKDLHSIYSKSGYTPIWSTTFEIVMWRIRYLDDTYVSETEMGMLRDIREDYIFKFLKKN